MVRDLAVFPKRVLDRVQSMYEIAHVLPAASFRDILRKLKFYEIDIKSKATISKRLNDLIKLGIVARACCRCCGGVAYDLVSDKIKSRVTRINGSEYERDYDLKDHSDFENYVFSNAKFLCKRRARGKKPAERRHELTVRYLK